MSDFFKLESNQKSGNERGDRKKREERKIGRGQEGEGERKREGEGEGKRKSK